jgi:hypothetical protein
MLLDLLVFLQPEGCAPMASLVLVRGGTVEMNLPCGGVTLLNCPPCCLEGMPTACSNTRVGGILSAYSNSRRNRAWIETTRFRLL